MHLYKYISLFTVLGCCLCEETSTTQPPETNGHISQDIQFFTNLVSDVSKNAADYFFFLRTAYIDIPDEVGDIAKSIGDYLDDSYTTLLNDPDFDFSSLAAFATNLGWYSSRLAVSGVNGYEVSSTESSSSEGEGSMMYVPVTLGLMAAVIGLL